jgi:hypothetical protein
MGNNPSEGLKFMSALDNLPQFDSPDGQISQGIKSLRSLVIQEMERRLTERKRRSGKPDED